jgi:protein gp37
MSDNSKIEWTDATWKPMRGVSGQPFEFGFDLRLVLEKLGDPIRWPQPKQLFVNSMSGRSAAVPGPNLGLAAGFNDAGNHALRFYRIATP